MIVGGQPEPLTPAEVRSWLGAPRFAPYRAAADGAEALATDPLRPAQEAHLVELWRAGKHTSAKLAALFSVARSTVYRGAAPAGEPIRAKKPARG